MVGKEATIAGLVLGSIALVLLVLAQFAPWASYDAGTSEPTGYAWGIGDSVGFGIGDDGDGWFDDSNDNTAGADEIRVGAPFLAASAGLTLLGLILVTVHQRTAAGIAGLLAGVAGVTATILIGEGMQQFFAGLDYGWKIGVYLANLGFVLSFLAGVLAFMPSEGLRSQD